MFALLTLLLGPALFGSTALFAQEAHQGRSDRPSSSLSGAQPQPDASGLYKSNGRATAPQIIFSVDPTVSPEAAKKRLDVICNVRLIVDAQGNPQKVHVMKSLADGLPDDDRSAAISLDKKAVEAVKKYRFKPSMLNGKPVPIEISVEVHFKTY